MAKQRRNPDETNEQVVSRMNETLCGQHGIVMMTGENRPKYVGVFIKAEMKGNLLIRFSEELVLFFLPLGMVNVVGEPDDKGGYPGKVICDELYVGDKTLGEIFADEVEEIPVPKPPTVSSLIKETGTFTCCQELVDKFVANGLIRKEGRVLHVSMDISSEAGCICGLAERVEEIESLTRNLKKFFDADEIIYHHTDRTAEMISIVEVDPGYKGHICELPGAFEGDSYCGTYPVIRGLGMRWEPLAR